MKALLIALLIVFSYSQKCSGDYPNELAHDACCKKLSGDIDECINCQGHNSMCYKCRFDEIIPTCLECSSGHTLKETTMDGHKINGCFAFSNYLISGMAVLIALITLL